jgi:sugar phosphate permease
MMAGYPVSLIITKYGWPKFFYVTGGAAVLLILSAWMVNGRKNKTE